MPAPANDNFANRVTLPGHVGSVAGDCTSATTETGEPDSLGTLTHTVWYQWTAPVDGLEVSFTLIGSGGLLGNEYVSVFTGTAVGALSLVDEDFVIARIASTTAGVVYKIRAAGAFNAQGPFTLSWDAIVPPAPQWYLDHYEHEFTPVVVGMPAIQFDGNLIQTVRPENLHFVLRLGVLGAEDIDYELSRNALDTGGGGAVSEDSVGAYRTDFQLRRSNNPTPFVDPDEILVLAGMHTAAPAGQDGETPNEFVKIAGKGYLDYLDHRIWPYDADLSYVNWPDGFRFKVVAGEIGQMVKDILETVRDVSPNYPSAPDPPGAGGHPSYSMQYIVDCDDTTHNRDYEIAPFETSTILQLITTLAQAEKSQGGFDFYMYWDNVTDFAPKFRLVSPDVGDPTSPIFTLEVDATTHLANIREAEFTNTGPEATHVLGLGAGTASRQGGINKHSRENSARFRRLDKAADFGEVKDLDTLEGLTIESVGFGLQPVHEIPITVDARDITDFWSITRPGQYIQVNYDFGWHTVNSVQRIVEMDCTISLEGEERVVLSLNQYYDPDPADPVTDW